MSSSASCLFSQAALFLSDVPLRITAKHLDPYPKKSENKKSIKNLDKDDLFSSFLLSSAVFALLFTAFPGLRRLFGSI